MKSWSLIRQFCDLDAVHRKGFCINDISPSGQLVAALEELTELCKSRKTFSNKPGSSEHFDLYELADVLSILFHFAQKQGWTMEQVDEAIIEKLLTRFTIPEKK